MGYFKGTPGPWFVVEGVNIFTDLGAKNSIGDNCDLRDGWQIASATFSTTNVNSNDIQLTFNEVNANAKLIAAAPELVAVLQLILSHHDDRNCELHSEDVRMAREAISKALGD